jgi:dihydrofolate reductase
MVSIAFVVAVAENGVIGAGGGMPWRLPSDLKRFRRLTLDKPIVMGRKTFQTIGKPLDKRDNIVVTRSADFSVPGVLVANSVEAALDMARRAAKARGADEIAVIGGGEIYRLTMSVADRIYLTIVHTKPDGDTRFKWPDPDKWREVERHGPEQGEKDSAPTSFVVLERV